ncbi:glycosyltransferase [Fusobacterium sp. PH5-44]|uniref:glycosyltransferase n=1 Tax=unclassified Fusobacterium TaxID=2648384 RepID=UPI003D1A9B55
MKILHISTSDKTGGAAIAAYRLHVALLKNGINSKMLVLEKTTDDKEIFTVTLKKIFRIFLPRLMSFLEQMKFKKYKNRENMIMFSQGKYGFNISKHPSIIEADVIHLHWINNGMLSIKEIKKISQLGKKIIWTLHDMWAFTGGCHYSGKCLEYENKCGNCKILSTNELNDITRKNFEIKKKYYQKMNLKLIGCSEWIGKCVRNSSLFREKEIKIIPNIIDKNIFKPIEKCICRNILNLDLQKKYILFGAINSNTDKRKGHHLLMEALKKLKLMKSTFNEEIEILIFGSSHFLEADQIPFKIKFFGHVYDEITLALIYNSVDVFVAPSLEDNLPNTVNESLLCGTPVVAFKIGGMGDMINHLKNGYLAIPNNSTDLAFGILKFLHRIDKVNSNFDYDQILKEMISYYKN